MLRDHCSQSWNPLPCPATLSFCQRHSLMANVGMQWWRWHWRLRLLAAILALAAPLISQGSVEGAGGVVVYGADGNKLCLATGDSSAQAPAHVVDGGRVGPCARLPARQHCSTRSAARCSSSARPLCLPDHPPSTHTHTHLLYMNQVARPPKSRPTEPAASASSAAPCASTWPLPSSTLLVAAASWEAAPLCLWWCSRLPASLRW